MIKNEFMTGFSIPLSAVRTEDSPVIGEFTTLPLLAEFAKKSGMRIIQILPVLDTGTQSSPYSSLSAFALHPIYINLSKIDCFQSCIEQDFSFKKLYDDFLLHKKDERFDYEYVLNVKNQLLRKLFSATFYSAGKNQNKTLLSDFQKFIKSNEFWLPAYCVYKTLKYKYLQASWKDWPKEDRIITKSEILKRWKSKESHTENYFYAWLQFTAFNQLKKAADKVEQAGIILKGDVPILLNEDSCDVWGAGEVFNMKMRAGSPPDGDNPAGQNWGFPCYDFAAQEKNDFEWWKNRLRITETFFNAYRLDHIPGFFRLWSIPDGELTAELGHSEPCASITFSALEKEGFSKERIRWLSLPHLPTEDFIRLLGDFDTTHEILSLVCDKINREELWLFKPSIKSESDIRKINLDRFNLDKSIENEILRRLGHFWKNRTLIEVKKNAFVPNWKYGETKAWNSLSQDEKDKLLKLFKKADEKQQKLWKEQAEKIFGAIIPSVDMTPCGEDLGVNISFMEEVLDEFGILGLKVFRWCREWNKPYQPYIDIRTYRHFSVATTSVHDSSTLRERYDTEMKNCPFESRKLHAGIFFGEPVSDTPVLDSKVEFSDVFDTKMAQLLLETYAKTSSIWYINPLQDWLYLDKKYYSTDSHSERINVPGTVSSFNWTWRMGMTAEKLLENEKLCTKIRQIVRIHDKIDL